MLDIKKKSVKIGALCLAGMVAAGAAGVQVYAKNDSKNNIDTNSINTMEKEAVEKTEQTKENIWQFQHTAGEAFKEETVYVLAAPDGVAEKIIVSDRMQNGPENFNETKTGLQDVMVVKNDENGLYYRGNSDKELPVTMTVTYMLDGAKVTPQTLSGKSGHVVIRYDFTCNEYETKNIEGSQEKIAVPFVAVTGMILDNTQFQNVTVSSGKVINDGSRCVVAGIAFPGMAENLNLEEASLPDYLEVEADVTDFSIEGTYTVIMNEMFNDLNLDDVEELDDLKTAMSSLTEAMNALMDGSSDLYDGLEELYTKSGDFKKGIRTLVDGAGQIATGAAQLNNGIKELQTGAASLSTGLNTLNQKSSELTGGAAQVFNSLLDTANKQIAASGLSVPTLTIDNYNSVLNQVLASMGQDGVYAQVYEAVKQQVADGVKANESAIRAGVTQAVEAQVQAGVLSVAGMTMEQYQAIKAAGDGAAQEQKQAAAAIDAAVAQQLQSPQIQEQIETAIAAKEEEMILEKMSSSQIADTITAEVQKRLPAAENGAAQIAALKAQLDSYNTFYQGILAYTSGVAQASDGANKLTGGANQLAAGADTLAGGAESLKGGVDALAKGSDALIDGISQLKDGAMQLRDGLTTFNEEGIEKLTQAFEGDFDELFARLQAVVETSQNYHSYTDSVEDMDGSVRFFYKTAEIK